MNSIDLVFLGGSVVDPRDDQNATALAANAGRVVLRGSDQEVWAMVGPDTNVVDLRGRSLVPAFSDCHCHLEMASIGLVQYTSIHVPPYSNIPSMLDAVAEACRDREPGDWVLAQGNLFHDLRLAERRYPTRDELDTVSTRHRIALRLGAHVTVLNSAALAHVAAIDTPLDRSLSGWSDGIFLDVWEHLRVPPPTETETKAAIAKVAVDYFLSRGVTAVGNVTETQLGLGVVDQLVESREMNLRVANYFRVPVTFGENEIGQQWEYLNAASDHRLWAAGVKLFADGGISARLAATWDPYPGTTDHGALVYGTESLAPLLGEMATRGIQVMTHCGGDKAADLVMAAYEAEFARSGGGLRWRIEHVGNPYATDARLARLRESGILGVPNPTHLYSIGDHYASLAGPERAEHESQRFRTMMDEGMLCPGNSDLTSSQPESSNPMVGVAAAVTRRTWGGQVVGANEAISVREALRMYTWDSAYALGAEEWRGHLGVGSVADLVVLDRNVLMTPDDELHEVRVDLTYVDGDRVFSREGVRA